jgi:hypothetical protein
MVEESEELEELGEPEESEVEDERREMVPLRVGRGLRSALAANGVAALPMPAIFVSINVQ